MKTGKVLWTFQTGPPDRGRPVDLLGRRQGVRRDHGRRHADVVERRHRRASCRCSRSAARSTQSPPPPLRVLQSVKQQPRAGAARRASFTARARTGLGSIPTQGGLVVRALGGELVERRPRQRPRAAERRAGRGRDGVDGRLHGPAGDGEGRQLPHRRRHHDPAAARRARRSARRTRRCTGMRSPRASAPRSSRASGGFSVGYRLQGLHARRQKDGSVLVTGRLQGASGQAPPTVHLLTYQLGGHDHECERQPGAGRRRDHAHAGPRLLDALVRVDANGHYTSFFAASDETRADPVILAVGVASGGISYGGTLGTNASFKRLQSATLNIKLGTGTAYTIQPPTAQVGAVYSGSRRRRHGRRQGREAARGALARREGLVLDAAPRLGARQDAALLGEPAAVVLALPGAARRLDRPCDVAVAARRRRPGRARLALGQVATAAGRSRASS